MYGSAEGFVFRSTITNNLYRQSSFKSDRLIHRNRYFGEENVYTSMNTFYKRERKVEVLKRLNALYVDLDCYKIGLSQEQVLAELEAEYFDHVLPVPTFVINSGRGLYLIWKINEDRNALPRWTSVQNYLFEMCKKFNADAQALDAARILRVPYSVNANNGATVSIMRFHDVEYTLYEIINEYDIKSQTTLNKPQKEVVHPYGEATENQRRCAAFIAEQKGLDLPDFTSYKDTFSFIQANYSDTPNDKKRGNLVYFNTSNTKPFLNGRCRDLIRLFTMRRGEDCRREYALFLYRLWLCESTNDYDYALAETLLFNSRLDCPFPDDYVIKRTESAEKIVRNGDTYKYGKQKIIEVLAITDEEMSAMHYLCNSPETDKERKSVRNHKAYLKRLESEGKETKEEAVKTRREAIAAMLADGKEKSYISKQLGISLRTLERDMLIISAENIVGRATGALQAVTGNIQTITDTIVTVASEAVETATAATEKAVKSAVSAVASKFQSTYYRGRSPACGFICFQRALFDGSPGVVAGLDSS